MDTAPDFRQKLTTRELAIRDRVKEATICERAKLGAYPGGRREGRGWLFPPDVQYVSKADRKQAESEELDAARAQATSALDALRLWRSA